MVKFWHCDMHSAPDPDSVQWNADQAGTSWCSLGPTLRNGDGYIFITVHIILYLCKKFPFIHYLCEIDIHCSGRSPATHKMNIKLVQSWYTVCWKQLLCQKLLNSLAWLSKDEKFNTTSKQGWRNLGALAPLVFWGSSLQFPSQNAFLKMTIKYVAAFPDF